MTDQKEKIPPSLVGLLGSVLADDYTHAELNSLFLSASAPGDPPDGNKVHKVQEWLRRINKEHAEPLKVLGDLLGEYLDNPARLWSGCACRVDCPAHARPRRDGEGGADLPTRGAHLRPDPRGTKPHP